MGGGRSLASVTGRRGAGAREPVRAAWDWGEGWGVGNTYPESLHAVALRPVPLDDNLPQVQEENIPTVETLPRHLHLERQPEGR